MVTNVNNIYKSYLMDGQGSPKVGTGKQETKDNNVSDSTAGYAEDGVILELSNSGTGEFKTTRDLMSYLSQNYDAVSKGMVNISGSFLQECLTDEDKRQKLFDMLADADAMVANAEENIEGYQGMNIKIDKDGNMETETYGGKVAVNEGKRLRQIASAKTTAQVQAVIALLNGDLSDCESGRARGMCDENEINKVKALLQKAAQRMSEVSNTENDEKEEGFDEFTINMLM